MSLHGKCPDRPPAEDRNQTCRLYPSLPESYRYEVCELAPQRSAARPPARDTQREASAGSADVRVKAQILILEEQRKELLSINEKWAKEFRTMNEYYKEKVKDLKASLHHAEEETRQEREKNTLKNKQVEDKESTRSGDAASDSLRAEKEAKELRALNSTLTRRWRHQHQEIQRLNKALEEALQTSPPLDEPSETLRDIWKHQAEVYKEDFSKERRDREKLKEKYLELEKKFRRVHGELRLFKPQLPQTALECTCGEGARRPGGEVQPRPQRP